MTTVAPMTQPPKTPPAKPSEAMESSDVGAPPPRGGLGEAKGVGAGPAISAALPMTPPRVRARANDAFPTTVAWLGARVGEGALGVDEANRHIMTIYAHPLKVYFLGCTLRWVGEADDVVQGFFADRLSRSGFLAKWLASQRPLRFWLITGFKHYLMETAREVQKRRAMPSIDAGGGTTSVPANEIPDLDAGDHRAFDREVALGLVREATSRAEQSCRADGLDKHWEVFVRHHVDGQPYERIAPDVGVDRARCAVMARTAATRYKAEVRALVAWDGATEEQIDREIRQLLEVTGS